MICRKGIFICIGEIFGQRKQIFVISLYFHFVFFHNPEKYLFSYMFNKLRGSEKHIALSAFSSVPSLKFRCSYIFLSHSTGSSQKGKLSCYSSKHKLVYVYLLRVQGEYKLVFVNTSLLK